MASGLGSLGSSKSSDRWLTVTLRFHQPVAYRLVVCRQPSRVTCLMLSVCTGTTSKFLFQRTLFSCATSRSPAGRRRLTRSWKLVGSCRRSNVKSSSSVTHSVNQHSATSITTITVIARNAETKDQSRD